VRKLGLPKDIIIVMVNESGASVYSASDVAREEFPDYDITVRGAVSIGRRLMDPLSELVKIDAKSIGVGQYQHDVDQSALKGGLDDTVVSCVNAVGVEINTASKQLLTYVSGLGPHLARKIIGHREKKGPFKARTELMDISGFGPKAFEQAAGFLRIVNAENPLDKSAVHPESYHIVERMAKDLKCSVEDMIANENLRKRIDLKKYQTETVGMPTLQDIMDELAKPGRDPREMFEPFSFAENVNTVEDVCRKRRRCGHGQPAGQSHSPQHRPRTQPHSPLNENQPEEEIISLFLLCSSGCPIPFRGGFFCARRYPGPSCARQTSRSAALGYLFYK